MPNWCKSLFCCVWQSDTHFFMSLVIFTSWLSWEQYPFAMGCTGAVSSCWQGLISETYWRTKKKTEAGISGSSFSFLITSSQVSSYSVVDNVKRFDKSFFCECIQLTSTHLYFSHLNHGGAISSKAKILLVGKKSIFLCFKPYLNYSQLQVQKSSTKLPQGHFSNGHRQTNMPRLLVWKSTMDGHRTHLADVCHIHPWCSDFSCCISEHPEGRK